MNNVWEIILGIVGALIVLTLIVVAHEYGHYKVGRLFKFRIMEFAVGMGPKLWKTVKNDITYSIRALPIGGFTRFYGEDEVLEDKDAFNKQPVGRRAAVIAAGPVMNIIVAWLLAVIFLCAFGDYTPVINSVQEGSPAAEAGLKPGDAVLAVDGNKIDLSAELADIMAYGFTNKPTFTIQRGDKTLQFKDIGLINNGQKNIVGITFAGKKKYFGFFEAVGLSFKWLYVTFKETVVSLYKLIFMGKGVENVMGPVGIVSTLGTAVVSVNFELLFTLAALISLSLAIFNLIPFPALDGGRLVLLGIEKIRKKPLPGNVEGYMNFVGFVILMALMVVLVFKDIFHPVIG